MKLNKDKLFLLDYKISSTLTIIVFIQIIILIINNSSNIENTIYYNFFNYIFYVTLFLYLIYSFIKSIFGEIYLINALFKKEIIITKHNIFNFSNVLYFILIFCSIIFYLIGQFLLNINNTFQLSLIMIIYLIINMFGLPMWYIYFSLINNKCNNMEIDINNLSKIIIVITSWIVVFGLTIGEVID